MSKLVDPRAFSGGGEKDGGSSISRGRAHIHIFLFTDRKKSISKEINVAEQEYIKMTPSPHY